MIFRQLFDYETYTYSYLIASDIGREALIIDPVKSQLSVYLRLIEELQLKLVFAIDTHVHADHITALGKLQEHTQCQTIMGQESPATCVSLRVKEGEPLIVDSLVLNPLYTPGHTDDSYSFLMDDRVFTGDTLLIRGTGRTDFQNGDSEQQFDSLFNKLLCLPEHTLVYPGHDYHGQTVSTIAEEKQFNPRLQVNSKQEYVDIMANLNLPKPKFMDIAVPANLQCGNEA
tara:strand:+ start:77684 stop:78370 length:687 start_codon:yes stop_codon:yes gene_type:complete